MAQPDDARGRAVVMQPEDGPSFWQPVPANGYSHIKLTPAATGYADMSSGFQYVAPGGHIRGHSHHDQIELQICFRGEGRVVVDGTAHKLVPGTVCFLGPQVVHEIINRSADQDLVMLWLISPPGLERFFESIGRPREPGTPPPEPFARPEDVLAVEQDMGFRDVKPSA